MYLQLISDDATGLVSSTVFLFWFLLCEHVFDLAAGQRNLANACKRKPALDPARIIYVSMRMTILYLTTSVDSDLPTLVHILYIFYKTVHINTLYFTAFCTSG